MPTPEEAKLRELLAALVDEDTRNQSHEESGGWCIGSGFQWPCAFVDARAFLGIDNG